MPEHAIIVIGASAGGVEGLIKIVAGLPADLDAAIFITLHLSPNNASLLPAILSRSGPLTAHHPEDFEAIRPGRIYIAPPDHHLLVERGFARVTRGPKENGHRPAIDPLFRSAAAAYGPKVIGIVLSGARDDGTQGLAMIKEQGGITIAQDPAEALYASMPRNAIDNVQVDHILPVADIPPLLARLALQLNALADTPPVPGADPAEAVAHSKGPDMMPGHPSGFICPDCGGSLWQMGAPGLLHFRCHVGHAWSAESLLEAELSEVEEALWTAYRVLQDHITLALRVAENARRRGNTSVAAHFERRAQHMSDRATVIHHLLLGGENGISDIPGADTGGGNGASDLRVSNTGEA